MKFVPITEVCDFQGGTQPPKEEWESQPKQGYVRMLQIRDFTQKKIEHVEYVKISGKIKTCDADDILIGRYGASIGKILTGLSGAYNVAIVKTIPDQNQITKLFLYYVLKNAKFQSFIGNIGGRAAQAGFNKEDLSTFQIPLPPLPEQIHIANVLSKAEALIAKRKESLSLLDAYLKSTFLEMFGEKEVKKQKWPLIQISDLAANHKGAMRTGPFGSNLLHSEFTEEGDVAVLGIDNAVKNKFLWGAKRFISKEKYEELKAYRIFPGDVIITIMGTVGRSAVIPDNIPLAINTKHLAALTFDKNKANPKFICFSFQSNPSIIKQIQSKNRGAIMDGLNLTLIKELRLHLPPLEIQNQFTAVVEKVEALKEKYQKSLRELEALYGALSQRAFRGELGKEDTFIFETPKR